MRGFRGIGLADHGAAVGLRRPKLGGRDRALWVVNLPKDDLD
jgi:hypothetical protein